MEEREYARSLCERFGRRIVDEEGGVTMGGIIFSERYAKLMYRLGKDEEVTKGQMALRHWVKAVGYDPFDDFVILMSDSILNC